MAFGAGGRAASRMTPARFLSIAALGLVLAYGGTPAEAQDPVDRLTPVIDGPPAPQPPEVISRDAAGRVTVRAVRLAEPIELDGGLDEPVYQDSPSMSGFIQQEPAEGTPATEETEIWVFFDRDHVYISARCWDSAPESEWVANEMRRDSLNIGRGDFVTILLGTFYDRRSANLFTINSIGGRMDGQVTDERYTRDWNPIWEVRPGRFEDGWTFEAAIPFKSLRYRPGRSQVWSFNVQRNVRRKNESSYLVPMPAARGLGAMNQVSLAGTLVGLEAPEGTQTLELKPFVTGDLTNDRIAFPPVSNAFDGDIGLDVKYGITQNLVADVTVNTDFAQVEADEQQVNLTRFSLFFPEKREFFLENQGLFTFGGAGAGPFGGSTPVLFYSRRIGIEQGREVPFDVGGRLTGRIGAFSVGALNIQTGDEPVSATLSTNFTAVRVRRDVLRRSSVGGIFTRRSVSTEASGSNETYGLDGTFGFYDNLSINTYWATTRTPGLSGGEVSYRGQFDYSGDRYGVQLEHLLVGDHFNPEVGFVRRDDMRRSFASLRFSPRPASIEAVRQFSWSGTVDYIEDTAGRLETREVEGEFQTEFENGDALLVSVEDVFEYLKEPFAIAPGVTLPVGGYDSADLWVGYSLGTQRRFAGTVFFEHGGFFSGDKTTAGVRGGRFEVTPQISVEPSLSFNWVDLPEGSFTTELVTARTTYTVTPLMFVSALVQYNSSNDSLGANLRLRWEYQPGSELFIVYNEQRDTMSRGTLELENRAFVIKVNRLFRF